MIVVQVFSKHSGKPKSGARVTINKTYHFFGYTASYYTDKNGCAYVDTDPCTGEVYVDGDMVHEGHLEGLIPVFV